MRIALVLVVLAATNAMAAPGHPMVEKLRTELAAEIDPAVRPGLAAVDASRTVDRGDREIGLAIADALVHELVPAILDAVGEGAVAKRFRAGPPIKTPAAERAAERSLRTAARALRGPPSRRRDRRDSAGPKDHAAALVELAAEMLADKDDVETRVVFAVEAVKVFRESVLEIDRQAAVLADRERVLARELELYRELAAMVTASGGRRGANRVLAEFRGQLEEAYGAGAAARFAKTKVQGTVDVKLGLRIADQVVRDVVPETLDAGTARRDATALRALKPLVDGPSVAAAIEALRMLSSKHRAVLDGMEAAELARDLVAAGDGELADEIAALSVRVLTDQLADRIDAIEADVVIDPRRVGDLAVAMLRRVSK